MRCSIRAWSKPEQTQLNAREGEILPALFFCKMIFERRDRSIQRAVPFLRAGMQAAPDYCCCFAASFFVRSAARAWASNPWVGSLWNSLRETSGQHSWKMEPNPPSAVTIIPLVKVWLMPELVGG